uniref:protein-tyrosine sulfotransferase-like isoform X1 n=1 Tax=Styela clava TaxID=7725 RepID=UPI00193A9DAE|nr:protein-tyrosine sulfotransferase-like isoform X1 [Styela clava]
MSNIKKCKAIDNTSKKIHPENETDLPLIFIGGVYRSGTTLMQTIVESHPDIRCVPETHVITKILMERDRWLGPKDNIKTLQEAGAYPEALDIAMAKFILEIIKGHGPSAVYYCNKEPVVLQYMKYMHKLFPHAKFIFMIRDGRAVAHSIVTRNIKIENLDISSYRKGLQFWNALIKVMNDQCKELGENICLPVYYEQLLLQPINTTKQIFKFLDIPRRKNILHHEKHPNKTRLFKNEFSTNQVMQPLHLDSLTSWFGHIPRDVERDMKLIAPMLSELGYDPEDSTPKYGEPEYFNVADSTCT